MRLSSSCQHQCLPNNRASLERERAIALTNCFRDTPVSRHRFNVTGPDRRCAHHHDESVLDVDTVGRLSCAPSHQPPRPPHPPTHSSSTSAINEPGGHDLWPHHCICVQCTSYAG